MWSYVQKHNVPLFLNTVYSVSVQFSSSLKIAVYLDFFHQQPCYIFSALSLSSCHSPWFPSFTPDSESEIYKILSNCPNKQSDSDPIPTWLLKQCSSVVVSTVTNIVILSLTSSQFLPTLKESVISPMLKKPTLDKEELSNYRPISNLSLISKLIERVVISRLMDHLTSNSFLNWTSTITSSVQ